MNYYTYTIYFVDGYYYHGYHKHQGVDPLTDGYYGSPVTHKEKWLTTMHWKEITGLYKSHPEVQFAEQEAIRPVFRKDPLCLNANCNGVIPPEFASIGGKKSGKIRGEEHRQNKTAICDPVNQEKGRQTARNRGSGFFDAEFQQSDMMKKNRRDNGKKTGAIAAGNGQLAAARACIDKRNQARAGTENLKKAHEKTRKPVEIVTPEGKTLVFRSISDASRALLIDGSCISNAAKIPGKKTKGHSAKFLG